MHTKCWLENWRARDPMGDLAVKLGDNIKCTPEEEDMKTHPMSRWLMIAFNGELL